MAFRPLRTDTAPVAALHKVLLYAHHGWGKTTTAKYMQELFGPGFVLSGEAGLRSLSSAAIDFLPFSSWDGENDPEEGVYSFKGLVRIVSSPEFRAAGYSWIMLDSLTELSDQCLAHWQKEHEGSKNGFHLWGDYGASMVGAMKWLRDLPYHIVVTALAKEEQDDNGEVNYWPFLAGKAVQKQIPGIFDHVFAGVRATSQDEAGAPTVSRFVVTDEVRGYHGKVRDANRRLKPIERTGNIATLLSRLNMKEDEYSAFVKAMKSESKSGESK